MNPVDPTPTQVPTTTPTQPAEESKWSGRKIAMAVGGALLTVALLVTGLFLLSKRSPKEENINEIALGEFLQVHNNPKFDGELARVLQTMEEKKQAKLAAQIQNDALYAQSINT